LLPGVPWPLWHDSHGGTARGSRMTEDATSYPANTHGLVGKVALVTGAATGIGRAVAHAFARHGASVVVTDIDEDGARRVAREITDRGGEATSHGLDVTR